MKMKKLFFACLLVPYIMSAQIKFEEGSWEDAVAKSQKTGKLIFLDAFATWCRPCKEMEEYTFTDLEVANYYNAHFINVHLDMEKYPGVELAEQYVVMAYPTLLFINGKGEVVHRGCGAMGATEFLSLGKAAREGSLTLRAMNEKYENGDRSVDFMMDYLKTMENGCLDVEQFAERYLREISLDQLTKETPWEVFVSYQWDIYSREFQYVLKNRSQFDEQKGRLEVDKKLYATYLSQYQEIYESEELHDFGMRALLDAIKSVDFSGSDTLKLMMNLHYAEYIEDWESYATHAIALVEKAEIDDSEQLNELAWMFYLFIEDKEQLTIASEWAKKATDKLPEPSWIDTYASLLFKLGDKKKAIELEEKALELAEELSDDVSHYQHQLKKFGK